MDNPKPLSNDEMGARYMRQSETANPNKFRYPITILGCGSHGSAVAIGAAKLGVARIGLIDFDLFEAHNVPNQFCLETTDMGRFKAEALADLCVMMGARTRPLTYTSKLEDNGMLHNGVADTNTPAKSVLGGIVVSTPDNMIARKVLFDQVRLNPNTPWLIDSRQAGFHIVIRVVNTMDMAQVKDYMTNHLYTDGEATPEPCGARAVIDTTLHVAAHISTIIRVLQMTGSPPFKMIDIDVSKGELTLTLPNGEVVSNREALAFATAE